MTTEAVTQERATEQLSGPKLILLSLLPGAMAVVFHLLAAPVVERLAAPPVLTILLGNALFIALFELGYMLFQGRRMTGKFSLKGLCSTENRYPGGSTSSSSSFY